MQLREMRVGNYYHWEAEGKKYLYKIEPKDFGNDNYLNFEEVQLTEEWLLKFGFQKKVFDSEETGYGIEYGLKVNKDIFFNYADDFSLAIYENEESENGVSILPEWKVLDKVHGLQNLVFALTGKELKIKDE